MSLNRITSKYNHGDADLHHRSFLEADSHEETRCGEEKVGSHSSATK